MTPQIVAVLHRDVVMLRLHEYLQLGLKAEDSRVWVFLSFLNGDAKKLHSKHLQHLWSRLPWRLLQRQHGQSNPRLRSTRHLRRISGQRFGLGVTSVGFQALSWVQDLFARASPNRLDCWAAVYQRKGSVLGMPPERPECLLEPPKAWGGSLGSKTTVLPASRAILAA